MSQADRPDRTRRRDPADTGDARDQHAGTEAPASPAAPDFGRFVSSSVRDSFRRLKPAGQPERNEPAGEPPPATSSRRLRRRPTPETGRDDAEEVSIGSPVGRRWRDTVPGGAAPASHERPDDDADAGEPPPAATAGYDIGNWVRTTFFDENGPTRRLLAVIAVIVLVILLIVFIWMQGGGGGGEETPEATSTTTTVLTTDRTATPGEVVASPTRRATQRSTQPGAAPGGERTPTETPRVHEGGDNQRG